MFFLFIVIIPIYLFVAYVQYTVYKKANVRSAILAWFPLIGFIPFYHAINRSAWNVLWGFIPVVNIVFGIIFFIEFLKAYGLSPWLVLISWIPLVPAIIYLYIAVSDVEYQIPYNSYAASREHYAS